MKPIDWDTTGLCEEHKATLRNIETIATMNHESGSPGAKVAAEGVEGALQNLRFYLARLKTLDNLIEEEE